MKLQDTKKEIKEVKNSSGHENLVEAEDKNTLKWLKKKKVSFEFEYNKAIQAKESVEGRLERLRKNKISKTTHLKINYLMQQRRRTSLDSLCRSSETQTQLEINVVELKYTLCQVYLESSQHYCNITMIEVDTVNVVSSIRNNATKESCKSYNICMFIEHKIQLRI